MNLCQPQVSIWMLLLSSVNPDDFDTDDPSDCSVLTGGLPLQDLISFHVGGFRGFFCLQSFSCKRSLSQYAGDLTYLSFCRLCHSSFPTLQFSEPRGCSWAVSEQVSQGVCRAGVTLVNRVLCYLFACRSVWHSLGARWGHGSPVWLYSNLQHLGEHRVLCFCTELPFSLRGKSVTDTLATVLLYTNFMWEMTKLLTGINWGVIMSWVSISRK